MPENLTLGELICQLCEIRDLGGYPEDTPINLRIVTEDNDRPAVIQTGNRYITAATTLFKGHKLLTLSN